MRFLPSIADSDESKQMIAFSPIFPFVFYNENLGSSYILNMYLGIYMFVFKWAGFAQSNFLSYNFHIKAYIVIGIRKKYIYFVSFLQELLRITKKPKYIFLK